MNTNSREALSSALSAEEVLARVKQLYAQLGRLGHDGTTAAAYKNLESEIRRWADRYAEISAAGSNTASDGLTRFTRPGDRPAVSVRASDASTPQ